jgi:non-specific serine/threonine protein kinase
MLTEEGVVKVLDFGLAKLSTQTKLTKESTTLGTVSYMSPEQAKGEEVDHRTDIWSLGVILYEMLTGQLPFKGEYESAVIYSILNDTQEPVTGLRTGVPMELERIINKCIQKSFGDRYQHVNELIVDLQGVRKQTESTIASTVKEPPKKRTKYVIMSVAVISIFILIVAGYFLIDRQIQKEEPEAKINTLSQWENSIAVLPFDDLSPEGDQEWFCDGMTEQVIGRTSVMSYKNTDKKLPEIGIELDVSHILEGSIRKYGKSIRVTAQLINTEDGSHLWADDFDRELEDIFDVQDDVSEKIAAALLTTLSPEDKKDIKINRPSSAEAYAYYMKGKHFFHNYDGSGDIEDFFKAEQMFKTAIQLDPNFADSYADLADLYNVQYFRSPDTTSERDKYMQLQEAYLDSAYRLDPKSAAVSRAKGWIHVANNEINDAFHSFKTAISINPNEYYGSMAEFLGHRGCYRLGIKCLNRAIESNPLNSGSYYVRCYFHMVLGELNEAERDFINASEIEHTLSGERLYYWLLLLKKQYKEANKYLTKLINEHPDQTYDDEQALLYAIEGQQEKVFKKYEPENWTQKLLIFSLLDQKDNSIITIQKKYEDHQKYQESKYLLLQNHPLLENIRSHPRYPEILEKHKELYEENLANYGDIDI